LAFEKLPVLQFFGSLDFFFGSFLLYQDKRKNKMARPARGQEKEKCLESEPGLRRSLID